MRNHYVLLNCHPTAISLPAIEISDLKLLVGSIVSEFVRKEFYNFSSPPDVTDADEYVDPKDKSEFAGLTMYMTFGRSTKKEPNGEIAITLRKTGQYITDFTNLMTYEHFKLIDVSYKGEFIKLKGRNIIKDLLIFIMHESKQYVAKNFVYQKSETLLK